MKEEHKIGVHIIDYLQKENNRNILDPVLKDWLKADDKNREDFFKYTKIWNSITILAKRRKFNPNAAWEIVNSKIAKRAKLNDRFKVSLLSSAAASLLILFTLSFYFNWFTPEMVTPLVLVTEFGNRSEAILPDGTKVQLNSGSELTYCYNKHKRVRNVQFSGEGYFEVKKDKKPFVIELQNGLSLQVLGTKFNLSSYPDDDMIETTLTEGRVELISSENKQLILEPGQIVSFNKKSGKLVYSQEKVSHNLGWMDRKLYMDNMSISEVCKVLERWYNIQITITQTEVVENVHYTGVLQEESVNDVLKALSEISPIKYIIEGQKITISKK